MCESNRLTPIYSRYIDIISYCLVSSIVPSSGVLSNNCNRNHKKPPSSRMAQYQSIPAATHQANAEPEENTVRVHKSQVWWISGAVMILFIGLGVVATTQTSRSSRSSILASTPPVVSSTPAATAALLRAATTTVSAEGASDMDDYDYVGWQPTTMELSELTCELTYSDGIDKVQNDCWKKEAPPNSPCNPLNGGDFYFEYDEYTSTRNEGYVDNKIARFERHYYVLMNKNKHHTVKLGKTEHRSITITAMRFAGRLSSHWETTEIPVPPYNCVMDCNVKYGFSWCRSLQRCTRPSDTQWSQPSDTICPDTVPVTTP